MSEQQHRRVAVAVVSWNTRELLIRCLRSLSPAVEAGQAEVWVVDNGSSDGSAEAVRSLAPWARLLEPGENLGFGRAVNLVARHSSSEWLVSANADVALEPGALEALLASGQQARVGCVAPRLVLDGGVDQHSVYMFPTIPFTLAFNLGLHRLIPALGDRLCLEGYWNAARERDVPWAIGALLLIRRAAFEEVGGFDERQWMYAEDLDLGWRLHQKGWKMRYEPRAEVLHESGAATALAFGDQRVIKFTAATYALLMRRRGPVRAWSTAAINVAGAGARAMWMVPLGHVAERWRAPGELNLLWLRAHLQGLRSRATLFHNDRQPTERVRPGGGAASLMTDRLRSL